MLGAVSLGGGGNQNEQNIWVGKQKLEMIWG